MAIGDIIVGIDVGYSNVSLYMGQIDNFNQIQEKVKITRKCNPYKDDEIDEIVLLPVLEEIVKEAEETVGMKINSAYVNIPGEYTSIIHKEYKKDTKDKMSRISLEDIVTTIIDASGTEVARDKIIIDIVPDKFLLDNNVMVKEPLHKKSETLTLLAQIIVADKKYTTKLQRIFREAKLEIDSFVSDSLANRVFYLEANELKSNIMLINIDDKSTETSVFFESTYIYSNTSKVGGDDITNDIAFVFQISKEEAEKLKQTYPLALKSYIENDNNIKLITNKYEPDTIKISDVVEILEGRIEDIFLNINKEIKKTGLKEYINGIVICGKGISYIYKSDIVSTVVFNIPTKFATSKNVLQFEEPYHKVYGMLKYISQKPYAKNISSNVGIKQEENILKKILGKIKEFFYS